MAVAAGAARHRRLICAATVDWPDLFKDAADRGAGRGRCSALPFIGLETYDIGGGALGVRTHFDRLAIVVAAVFAGRFAVAAVPARAAIPACRAAAGRWRGSRPGAAAAPSPITVLGVAFAVALPFLPFSSRYLVDLGTTVLIYVMLGWGLNIVVGLAGLLDLGYVAFYAVGAYTFALLARDFGFGFWEALPLSGAGGGQLSASCSAFRCCGCAATIWRSSRSASARSSASCC